MEFFSPTWNATEAVTTLHRLAWSLNEVSECMGLSVAFLRAEVRAGRLPVRRFGRRVLIRDEDLRIYLSHGSETRGMSK
jgi:excisionase family DNA binding protein